MTSDPARPGPEPAPVAWFGRFEVSISAECELLFGHDWRALLDLEDMTVCLQHKHDKQRRICVALHPGMHVVKPAWAARRVADQLLFEAVSKGWVRPPSGAADEEVI